MLKIIKILDRGYDEDTGENAQCYCFVGCSTLFNPGAPAPVNSCCMDWTEVAQEHCPIEEQSNVCGSQVGTKFGNVELIPLLTTEELRHYRRRFLKYRLVFCTKFGPHILLP